MEESSFLYNLGLGFSGLAIPQPEDLRGKLAINADAPKYKLRSVQELKGMVFHQAMGNSSIENVAIYHTGENSHLRAGGVESIAYTFGIRKDGQIVLCNDFNKSTWSQGDRSRQGDENKEFISVMFEGNFKGEGHKGGEPTLEQMISSLLLWDYCKNQWEWPLTALYGHYHFGKAACPGDTIKAVIEAIRS